MPSINIPFGGWEPDKPAHGHSGLLIAQNVYPVAGGYAPVGSFSSVTPALAGWTGGGAFTGKSGATKLLSGTSTALYVYSGSAWVSALSATAGRWRFSQNRQLVVGVHGGTPVKYDLTSSTAGTLGGSPGNAAYTATVGDFTFLAGDPADIVTVKWSGFANPEIWTPGTNQSGSDTLSDGGAITGLTGGEFGLVFQRGAIFRFTYTGGETVWQKDKISSGIGCIAPGSIAQAGKDVFFLSERGFMRTDGNDVVPIGTERVDRTFFAQFTRNSLVNIYAAADPRHHTVIWAMPGNPGVGYLYNWAIDRWAVISVPMSGVFQAFTGNVTSDAIDAAYPGGADALTVPMDSSMFNGGEPRIFYVSQSGVVGTLTGSNLAASVSTAFNGLENGRRSRPFLVRPVSDAVSGMSLQVDARARLGDTEAITSFSELRNSGDMPVRCNGRAFKFTLNLAAATQWTFLQSLEVEFGDGGKR